MDAFDTYTARQRTFADRAGAHARHAERLSRARLVAFGAAFLLGVLAAERDSSVLWMLALLAFTGFITLVVLHRRARRQEEWQQRLAEANRLGLMRIERRWTELPALNAPPGPAAARAAEDLDVFGTPGLTQLFGPLATPGARSLVGGWLVDPDPPEAIPERQQAVRALAKENDWRDDLAAHALGASDVSADEIASFEEWAESQPWLASQTALRWTARLLPPITIGLIVAQIAGAVDYMLWILPLMVASVLTFGAAGKRAHAVFERAFARQGVLAQYPALLAHAAEVPGDAPRLRSLRASLHGNGVPAHDELRRLERLMRMSELRYNGNLHGIVQLLTLWDFHVLDRLEAWQSRNGQHVRTWLSSAAEVEAIASLATLAHDQPAWAFPVIDPSLDRVQARSLGHPMLRDGIRICNDVEVGPPGSLLLVTGSNMSGKSTLLRAIGTNVILAQAGAPACAASLSLPPLEPWSSVRIRDSLTEGVSLFLAELQRMREIVEAARAGGERRLLYLLDEMLHGTNTAERRVAARTVIEHLLKQGAIGVVTTHDLELANEPALQWRASLVHFTEHVERGPDGAEMSFDYILRPGLATSTNALTLLEIVGL